MARHTGIIDFPWILRFLVLFGYFLFIDQSRADVPINNNGVKDTLKPFTLTEIYSNVFAQSPFAFKWNSDNEISTMDQTFYAIYSENVNDGTTQRIVSFSEYNLPFRVLMATYSADANFILVGYNIFQLFRYSIVGSYAILDPHTKKFEYVNGGAPLMTAMWSSTGSDLVYVHDNNIYHYSLSEPRETRRLTDTGAHGAVFNGVTDWVYEEEVLQSGSTLWFSPDGRYLAFGTIYDSLVQEIDYSVYSLPSIFSSDSVPWSLQYPQEVKLRYPKAGTTNPTITLSIIDLTDPSSRAIRLDAPVDVIGSDNILFDVTWWDSTHVIATWTNRVQNKSQLVMYDTQGIKNLIFSDEETEGWLRPRPPVRLNDYLLLHRLEDSGTPAGKFLHITRYEYDGERLSTPLDLTPGPSEVESIVAVDPHRGRVYYVGTAPGEPGQMNLYRVPLDGSQEPTCISCEILTPEGNNCAYASASFSTEMSKYVLTCLGPDPVTVSVYAVDHDQNDKDHGLIRTLKTYDRLRRSLSEKLMPQQRNFNINVNGYDSTVRLLLPPDFDENKSYPMLVYVYGGPDTVAVTKKSNYGYEYYLTTNKGVIYAFIDGRGSAYKGSKMLFEIYRHIGVVEVEDTIAVTAALQQRYSWIDANRTGIWGWSYGGFVSSMVLATDKASVFKCGLAVAPVTSWIYYDSIYTERIMGLPTEEDNLEGYIRTDVAAKAEGIRGKKFMLIHGSADDNVHYQQSLILAKSLESRDILFEQMTYTDEMHSLATVYPHLYHTMDRFWSGCFDGVRVR